MSRNDGIVGLQTRHSAITSHSIGVPELNVLLDAVPSKGCPEEYEHAVVADNVLGLKTASGRSWRFRTLRRLYLLRPDALLFRALRDLWPDEAEARPLLAGLCAMATDTVFRATAETIVGSKPGDHLSTADFATRIEERYPDAYAASTMQTIARRAYTSWQQTHHLGAAKAGTKPRTRAVCRPADVAYALLLGHLQGARGEALFDTTWAQVLDTPRSLLPDLAFAASQRGMIEFRSAGGVTEVGFKELLREMDGTLQL